MEPILIMKKKKVIRSIMKKNSKPSLETIWNNYVLSQNPHYQRPIQIMDIVNKIHKEII